jgi:hypothetical protein
MEDDGRSANTASAASGDTDGGSMADDLPPILTVDELADFLRLNRKTVAVRLLDRRAVGAQGFRLSDIELGDIRAVDYVLLNAMARSLQAAKAYDESAQRLMMDFTLSAGLRGERANRAKRGKAHRR